MNKEELSTNEKNLEQAIIPLTPFVPHHLTTREQDNFFMKFLADKSNDEISGYFVYLYRNSKNSIMHNLSEVHVNKTYSSIGMRNHAYHEK